MGLIYEPKHRPLRAINDLNDRTLYKDDHPIGTIFEHQDHGAHYTLTYVTIGGQSVLVGEDGWAIFVPDYEWDGQFKAVDSGIDWLTWHSKSIGRWQHTPLSNFYVEIDGKTLEHRFAAMKTTNLAEKQTIMTANTPGEAKKLGRSVTLRPDWDEIKRDVMWDLLLKKFVANPYAKKYLLATAECLIREKNTWYDRVWGVDLENRGQNLLGQGLMYVREVLNG